MWKFFVDNFRERTEEKRDTKIGYKAIIFSLLVKVLY